MTLGRFAGPARGGADEFTRGTFGGEAPPAMLTSDPGPSWSEPDQEPRDWKKLALVIGLGILSWVATYVGMLELIEANMGDLPITHKIIIGFSVAMLMTMIIWLLDQLFAPIPTFTKLVYGVGYLFLTLISVGFGFGFYWKVLESRSESSRSAESAVTQVQSSLHAASTRLEQLSTTLVQLTQISTAQAEVERAKGTSCPASRPGDGPRRKLRDDDAARFGFASEFVKGRAGQVKSELGALDGDLAKIAANDASLIDSKSGTRNEFMKALGRKLDLTVTGFNAFRTDPQLRQIRTDLAERAEKTTFPDTRGGTFSCPDPQLQTALRGVVRAIDQLPDLEKPKIAAVEGSEATIEAFRRLTATFYGALSFKLPPAADELRDLQKKAVQSVETPGAAQRALLTEAAGLSKRDYIPLAIAAFVDFCLLLVSMGRPANRLGGLVAKMREAERGPVIQILSRFNDIHRDPAIRQNFEVFRHVVFDFHGAYYVAVPLDAPYRFKKVHGSHGIGTAQIEELQQEAHLLVNLFASFEKEKIFSRVYSPLLSTKAIQRKLWRQGSKFAGCEAFRIYRFRDGAWSELILGAVMGAARRVEVSKRARRMEDEIARTFDAMGSRIATEPPARGAGRAHPSSHGEDWHAARADVALDRAGRSNDGRGQGREHGWEAETPETAPAGWPSRHHAPRYHGDQSTRTGAGSRHGEGTAQAPGREQGQALHHDVGAATVVDRPIAPAVAASFGPYAPFIGSPQRIPREAHHSGSESATAIRTAANGNAAPVAPSPSPTVPGEPMALPSNVTPLPNVAVRAQGALPPAGPRSTAGAAVDAAAENETRIVLSRTETISIPATAATLPAALARAVIAKPSAQTGILDATAEDVAAPAPAVLQLGVVSADDVESLRRFAPGAAE